MYLQCASTRSVYWCGAPLAGRCSIVAILIVQQCRRQHIDLHEDVNRCTKRKLTLLSTCIRCMSLRLATKLTSFDHHDAVSRALQQVVSLLVLASAKVCRRRSKKTIHSFGAAVKYRRRLHGIVWKSWPWQGERLQTVGRLCSFC